MTEIIRIVPTDVDYCGFYDKGTFIKGCMECRRELNLPKYIKFEREYYEGIEEDNEEFNCNVFLSEDPFYGYMSFVNDIIDDYSSEEAIKIIGIENLHGHNFGPYINKKIKNKLYLDDI